MNRHVAGDITYVMFSDGSVEVRSPRGATLSVVASLAGSGGGGRELTLTKAAPWAENPSAPAA